MHSRIKSYQSLPSSHIPGFASLLWDNFKTTAYFGSMVPGIAPILCCCLMSGENPEAGANCGQRLALALFGLPMGAAFSLPFTIGAKFTRQFKLNNEIDPIVNLISSCTNEEDQRYILKQIIANNNFQFGNVRSLESCKLLAALNGVVSLEKKWQALLNYLNAKTAFNPEAYVHNGKRTFNSIISIGETIAGKLQLRQAILEGRFELLNQFSLQDLLQKDWQNKSAFDWAVIFNRIDLLPYLFERWSEQGPQEIPTFNELFWLAGEVGETPMMNELLKFVGDEDRVHYASLSLRSAIRCGKYEVVKSLIESNNNLVNFQGPDNYIPLMDAALKGHLSIVEYLLSKKSAVNVKTLSNKTALQFADDNGHKEISRLLLANGAVDTVVNQVRIELKRLIPILFNHRWSQEGWGLFQDHIPYNLERMRNKLREAGINLETVDSITRDTVLDVVNTLKQYANTANPSRSPNTVNLYNVVKKLGNTNENDFEKLKGFTIEPTLILEGKFSKI